MNGIYVIFSNLGKNDDFDYIQTNYKKMCLNIDKF